MTPDELNRFALMNSKGEHISPEVIGDLIAEIRRLREVEDMAKEVMGGPVAANRHAVIFNTKAGAGVLYVKHETLAGEFRRAHYGECFYGVDGKTYVSVSGCSGGNVWQEYGG